jgi:hypothetical protein
LHLDKVTMSKAVDQMSDMMELAAGLTPSFDNLGEKNVEKLLHHLGQTIGTVPQDEPAPVDSGIRANLIDREVKTLRSFIEAIPFQDVDENVSHDKQAAALTIAKLLVAGKTQHSPRKEHSDALLASCMTLFPVQGREQGVSAGAHEFNFAGGVKVLKSWTKKAFSVPVVAVPLAPLALVGGVAGAAADVIKRGFKSKKNMSQALSLTTAVTQGYSKKTIGDRQLTGIMDVLKAIPGKHDHVKALYTAAHQRARLDPHDPKDQTAIIATAPRALRLAGGAKQGHFKLADRRTF